MIASCRLIKMTRQQTSEWELVIVWLQIYCNRSSLKRVVVRSVSWPRGDCFARLYNFHLLWLDRYFTNLPPNNGFIFDTVCGCCSILFTSVLLVCLCDSYHGRSKLYDNIESLQIILLRCSTWGRILGWMRLFYVWRIAHFIRFLFPVIVFLVVNRLRDIVFRSYVYV